MKKIGNTANKNTRRCFALVFTFIFVLTIFSGYPTKVSAETVTLKNIEPIILTDAGDTVELSAYAVEFPDGTVSSSIEWKHNGSPVTSFDAENAGVYTLVANSGDKAQNVFIVAKNAGDSEYVLYFNDFDSADSINDWKKTGGSDNTYTVSGGKLQINGVGSSNPRIYLPEWLSDIGNYRIDAVGTQTDATDASRWFSIIYRARNVTTTGTPYYHMAVRKNMSTPGTSTTGGIECVSNTGTWNYYKSTGYSENIDPSKEYTFSVLVKDSTVQYQVNGDTVIHLDELPSIADTDTGGIGLQANSSKFILDSIKITVLEEAPEYEEPEIKQTMQFVYEPESNIYNPPTNVAIIDSAQALSGLQEGIKPSNALMYIDKSLNVNDKDGNKLATAEEALEHLQSSIIPAFYVNDNETVDNLITLLKEKDIKDVLIVSADEAVAKYAREKYSIARNAVDFSAYTDTPTNEDLLRIRGTVTGAKSLIAILPLEYAVTDYVDYLQSLGITVWIKNGDITNDTEIVKMITSGANGLVTNDYKRIADSFTTLFLENTLTRTPIIIGHRGNPSQAPENSISGFLKAIENGADIVETDIKITKDGHIVIMHDDTLTRTTTYTGSASVSQMTLEEIKQYKLWGANNRFKDDYPDEGIPTLEEMFIALQDSDAKIFLEIKTGETRIIQPTVELIREYGYEDRIFVICFNSAQLVTLRNLMPDMGTGFLCMSLTSTSSPEQLHDLLYQNLLLVQACDSTLNPNYGNLTKDFLTALRHRGITCWPWTYSTGISSAFNSVFLWGVDGITTDDAQYSKSMIKRLASSDSNMSIRPDETASVTVDKVTFGGTSTSVLEDNNTSLQFLEGEDVIGYENGKITAKKEGTASFVISYKTRTASGTPYVLYTQPFTVTVKADEVSDESDGVIGSDFPTQTVIIVGAVLLLIIGAVFIFTRKKSK